MVTVTIMRDQRISEGQFQGDSNITKVVALPNSVILDNAFLGCSNITEVELSENVYVGKSAFSQCVAISKLNVIGNDVIFCEESFSGCHGIKVVTIPKKSSVDYHAFYNCPNIQKIHIEPDASIGKKVFHRALKIKEVNVDSAKFNDGAFYGCKIDQLNIGQGSKLGRIVFVNCEFGKILCSNDVSIEHTFGKCSADLFVGQTHSKICSDASYLTVNRFKIYVGASVDFSGVPFPKPFKYNSWTQDMVKVTKINLVKMYHTYFEKQLASLFNKKVNLKTSAKSRVPSLLTLTTQCLIDNSKSFVFELLPKCFDMNHSKYGDVYYEQGTYFLASNFSAFYYTSSAEKSDPVFCLDRLESALLTSKNQTDRCTGISNSMPSSC